MKWRFFIGACVLVAYGVYAAGAPIGAVAAGIVFAAILNIATHRKRSATQIRQGR